MLKVAAKKRLYAQLEACDCVAFLNKHVEPAAADLILACDVLVYMRELGPLFAAAARSLRPGGVFAFSTEKCEARECGSAGWVEQVSERMAHCKEYLQHLVAQLDGALVWRCIEETDLRRDAGRMVRGHLSVLVKAA